MEKDIQETFIDGIGSISFIGGVVRADLVKIEPNHTDKEQPSFKPIQRLIISPQGLLQTANAINDLVKKLSDSGILQQRSTTTTENKSDTKKK